MTEKRWNHIATQWRHWGPPLKPCADDIRVMERHVQAHASRVNGRPYRALLWGVTPEIAQLNWPANTDLLAMDKVEEMVQLVWPGDVPGRRRAVCRDWFEYPEERGAADCVIGDGIFNLYGFPADYTALAARAHQLLRDDGILIQRFFHDGGRKFSVAEVLAGLQAKQFGNFHIFKFRLAMAMQESPETGVELERIHERWRSSGFDVESLAIHAGWPAETIATIDHYRGKAARMSFPLWEGIERAFGGHFEVVSRVNSSYEMGECCPVVMFRKRGGA